MLEERVAKALDGMWLKSDDYSTWGKTPGKLGLKVIRGFLLYNITNPEEILEGELPVVVELPEYPTQEYLTLFDWEYVDKNLTGVGKVIFK